MLNRPIALCAALISLILSLSVRADDNAAWMQRPALYEVFVRDFSPQANFRGVEEGLDRIAATGANVIWLMPIYPLGQVNKKGPIGSPYAVADYRGINSDFGSADDLHHLINAAHSRKMKVILDFVANHTAWDHVWIKSNPDRYTHDASGKISVAIDNNGRATDWSDTADLNYSNPDTRKAMIGDMRYWLDNFDVDGFRMDVAEFVPDEFWKEAIPALRKGKPILMLAEAGAPKMHADGFDLTYGWSAYGELKDVWNKGNSAGDWVSRQINDVKSLPNNGRRLYFTTNHDEVANDKPPVQLFGGSAGARAAFVAVTLLPGVPLLYNGEEVESPQKLTLFDKQTVAWDQPDAEKTRAFYTKVVQLARTHPAFAGRDLAALTVDSPNDIIAYQRGHVAVLVNTRPKKVSVASFHTKFGGARDLLTGQSLKTDQVDLDPYGFAVLEMAQ